MRGRRLGLVLAMLGVSAAVVVSAAVGGGAPRVTALSGAQEVGGGDPDGTGFASITLNPGRATVCWSVTYEGIAPPTAAHIHVGPAGMNGPVVVPLSPIAEGCVSADSELIRAIVTDPDAYYVNVHNADFPGGAIRGQLGNRGHASQG